MQNPTGKDDREHVRAPISVPVKFTVMSPEQYDNIKVSKGQNRLHGLQKDDIAKPSSIKQDDSCTKFEAYLIDFLFRIDDKLDKILELLLRDEPENGKVRKGRALDISGAGMSIVYGEPLQIGDILNTNFLVSKFPPVWLDLYGEVVRIMPTWEGAETTYEIGLKFIDLDEENREEIIFYTFQQQRDAIRSLKGTDG